MMECHVPAGAPHATAGRSELEFLATLLIAAMASVGDSIENSVGHIGRAPEMDCNRQY